MPLPRTPFFSSARGRLLFFNLLVVAVTLMVCGVAVLGFEHASRLQEQVQGQTLSDMSGSMELALQNSLNHLAKAPLASHEPQLVKRITDRSNELESSVTRMLELGHRRHLERNALLSALYQNQSYLHHIQDINARDGLSEPDAALLVKMDRLIPIAIQTPSPKATVVQLTEVMAKLPARAGSPLVNEILQEMAAHLRQLLPLSQALDSSDLGISWYIYHIKALVAFLNQDINLYVQKVGKESLNRTEQSHKDLQSIIFFIGLFALLVLVITGFAGWYIYKTSART
jgi:hypothetical protein